MEVENLRKNKKVLFIIGSCIQPWIEKFSNGNSRAGCSIETRLQQTKDTIYSIRKYCQDADILLIDNGAKDFQNEICPLVEKYYYVGNLSKYKKTSKHSNKGIGETYMLLYALKRIQNNYSVIFKISGRYQLNSEFCLSDWDFDVYNFLNYDIEGRVIANSDGRYVRGSHSTRLFSFPGDKKNEMKKALLCGLLRERLLNESIETAMPRGLKRQKICYLEKLGVEGLISGRTYIKE